ncbi:hypothetical protein BHM03_00055513 [Ensete ventricosum]|nr:hypothetical protein BHM03_00055513 [Ensete ventricosum]
MAGPGHPSQSYHPPPCASRAAADLTFLASKPRPSRGRWRKRVFRLQNLWDPRMGWPPGGLDRNFVVLEGGGWLLHFEMARAMM